ncbi:MAG TPA: LEA type 2 family protein [Balneolaceae bacterium]
MKHSRLSPTHPSFLSLTVIFALILITGCSALQDIADSIQKPSLSIEDVRVTDFNFQEMELTYDVRIENPNSVAVQMLGYDYELEINDQTLVQGDQPEKVKIEGNGETTFQVPMTLNFSDIYNTVQSLADADDASYHFLSHLTFDLPLLGRTELPISKEGTIPLLKVPDIRVEDLRIENISFSSADLSLKLQFENPNGFGLDINRLNYDLIINGNQWAEGTALQNVHIKENGITELTIPISLNLSQIGASAYRILTGTQQLDYQLKGVFSINAGHELLGETNFDFNRSGEVSLSGN